jgi:hypothetical protein
MRPAANTEFSPRTNLQTAKRLGRREVGRSAGNFGGELNFIEYEEAKNQPTYIGEAAVVERRRVVLRGLSQIHLSERGHRPGKAPGLDSSTEGAKAEAFPPSPRL